MQQKHKLLLIIGKAGSGKSKYLHNYSQEKGIPILDFDQILGKKLPEGKDPSYIYGFLSGFLSTYRPEEILLDKKLTLSTTNSSIFFLKLSLNSTLLDCILPLIPIKSPFFTYSAVFSAIPCHNTQSIKSDSYWPSEFL